MNLDETGSYGAPENIEANVSSTEVIVDQITLDFSFNKETLKRDVKLIIKELFFAGTMPRTQKYLLENSFLREPLPEHSQPRSWEDQLRFLCSVNIVLRGIAQVYLCNNPLSGLLICIGLAHTSTQLLVYALVGTICSTLLGSMLCMPDSTDITSGLCG